MLVRVLGLFKLDKGAFAITLRQPKATQGGAGALGCSVQRKLERPLAACRGVAIVFRDDQGEYRSNPGIGRRGLLNNAHSCTERARIVRRSGHCRGTICQNMGWCVKINLINDLSE